MKNRFTERHIQELIIKSSRSMPANTVPDDLTMVSIITKLVVEQQASMSDETIAALVGIAGVLLKRVKLPAPMFRDDDGTALYTVEQIAESTGLSVADVEQAVDQLTEMDPDLAICPKKGLHRVQ